MYPPSSNDDDAKCSGFESFFGLYCSLICPAASGDAVLDIDTPALRTHADLLDCVEVIVQSPCISFNDFVSKVFGCGPTEVSRREAAYVAKAAVAVAFGVNCMQLRDHEYNAFGGPTWHYTNWEDDLPFAEFIEKAFRFASRPIPTRGRQLHAVDILHDKTSLKAWKITKRCGINIKKTDNLLEHLALDLETMTLRVFHQIAFLRAHLVKSKDQPLDMTFEESIKSGTLPPRLLLETLLTFHDVLFPITSARDNKSRKALETMIRRHDFDSEARWIEFVRPIPPNTTFHYWGDRLAALHDVVKRPPPTNAFVGWFERHTSERNALTIAILGLLLSVLFGLLSFIVGLLQLILAWMAYKYPPTATL